MSEYTYILAPNNSHNFAVLQQALAEFPDILTGKQIKTAYIKSVGDITSDGALVVPSNASQYIYLKARTAEIDASLLAQAQDVQVFNIDTQPFDTFWI